METFVYALHFIVCFVLIGVVLLQRGKAADLGASLGGGSANTIFGSRGAGNFLTKITTASAITFMLTSLTLSYFGYQDSDIRLFDEAALSLQQQGLLPGPMHASTGQEAAVTGAGQPTLPVVICTGISFLLNVLITQSQMTIK